MHAQIAASILQTDVKLWSFRCRQRWSLRPKLKSRRLMPPIIAWFRVGVPAPMTGVQASSAPCSSLDWTCLTARFIASVCITAQMQMLAFQARVRKRTETTPAPAFQVTKRVPARNTNAIATGRVAACHASSSAIEFEETVLCECHSGNCLDGTPDRNNSFTTTCGVAACGSMAASPTPGSSAHRRTLSEGVGAWSDGSAARCLVG